MISRRSDPRLNRGRIASAGGGSFPIATNRLAWVSTFYGDDTTHLTTGGTSKIQQFVNQDTLIAWAQGVAASQASWEATSLSSSMNGQPSCHPDGGDFYLLTEAAILAIAQGNSDHTLFIVASPDVAAAFGVFFSWGNSASASGYIAYGVNSTGVILAASTAAVRLGTTALTNKRPLVFAFKREGNLLKVWLNGVAETLDGAGAFAVGALPTVDRCSLFSRCRSTNDLKLTGQFGELFLYNRAISDADVVAQSLWAVERWQLAYSMFIAAGDSISRGFSTVSGLRLEERLAPSSSAQRYSAAGNGWTTANLDATKASFVSVRSDARSWTTRNVVCLWVGTNDIKETADSAVVIYARTSALVSYYRAHSAKVIILTCLRRETAVLSGDGLTPFNTIQAAYNVLINANTAGAETVVDVSALMDAAGYNPDGNPNALSSDGTHITDLAYDSVIVPALNTAYNALV